MVDIWLDESVCFGDAGWGEWEVGFGFCHFVFFFPFPFPWVRVFGRECVEWVSGV
jgi:hypothetical protein